MPSFYTPELTLETEAIVVTGSEYNHIINVFRKRPGDEVKLNSGNGVIAKAKLIEIRKGEVKLEVLESNESVKSEPEIAVAFSLLRNKNDHVLVEKLTELGVKHLFPFVSENSVRKPSKNTINKFIETSISAVKQCDNPFLPNIYEVDSLNSTIKRAKKVGFIPMIASELEGEPNISGVVKNFKEPVCIIIGPEGGFSPSEFQYFKENNTITYSLCNRVLRAETAAITSVAQLIAEYLKTNPDYQ